MDRLRRYAGWPSLRLGLGAVEAIEATLEPFEGLVNELMASLADSPLTWP